MQIGTNLYAVRGENLFYSRQNDKMGLVLEETIKQKNWSSDGRRHGEGMEEPGGLSEYSENTNELRVK